jgi:serine/threonine protein kinase
MNEQGKGSFSQGMVIGHRYEILRPLRSEAHGVVMLARDQVLDLDVGLKLLSNEHPEFARLLEYYRREALWGLRLHHPQILGVHHLDETTEGVFLIQEPFIGNSLWELLGDSEALTINDSLYFIEVLAQGVAYGHKQGVNHQNFNPQQVLVSATDGIKIINFAFPAEPTEILSFPEIQAYIAPEVWEGRHPSAASNLFSLGVIGYRMLTGAFPFPLHPEGALPYQIIPEPVAFDKIPEALQPLFNRCLKPEPEKRFQSAADFLSRLTALREKLTPAYAIKTRHLEEEAVLSPPAVNHKPEPKPTIGHLEPEVEIDSGWQESNSFHRQSFREKINDWLQDQKQQVAGFFGPEPLRRNRNKQVAAAIGGGLAFLLLIFGLSSLFSPKPRLKMATKPDQVASDTATSGLQASPAAKPPIMAASPNQSQEIKSDQTGSQTPPAQPKPSLEVTAPLATPVGAKPKTPAAPTAAAKPEMSVSKPEKTAQKTEKPTPKPEKATPKPTVQSPEPKAAKPDTAPKLVATLDKEMAARKQADALTKQGQRAIVKKAKQGGKTVYQVWIPTAATCPAKPATPATKPKADAKTTKPR